MENYAHEIHQLEQKEALKKKSWIYLPPPPPNKVRPRALTRSKIRQIFPQNEAVFMGLGND
jgi:hypothetical protein